MKLSIIIFIVIFIFISCSDKRTEISKTDTTYGKLKQTDTLKETGQKNSNIIKHASKHYAFKIEKDDSGKAKSDKRTVKINIYRINEDKPFQEIISASCNFSMNDSTKLPSVNNEKGINAIIINDYNFDGSEDIAVQNGMPESMQSTHPYDIYLFSFEKNNFILNTDLTDLTKNGMFDVDTSDKSIKCFYVSGCCHHETRKYKVVDNKPVLVYTELLNETGKDPDIEYYTKTLVNGKWKKGVIKRKE